MLSRRGGLRPPQHDLRKGRGRALHSQSKTDPNATLIPEITVDELIALDLPDLIIERPVLELMRRARHVKSVPSPLMRQTLLDRELVRPIDRPVIPLLPWLNVVVIGGRSIIDKGHDAVAPVVEELRAALPKHRMLILTGPGIRGRHVLGVGLDLGLPTGVLAALVSAEAEQNGHLIAALLAEQGVSYLSHATIAHQLAVHLTASRAAVSNGYPPYGLYEFPPEVGKIPPHRTDTGAFLLADAYGAARMIYVKDVDGVFTSDPADSSSPELVPRVGAAELLAMDLDALPIDALVLELMAHAKHQKEIQIVNGRTPGNITKALGGEHVGTIIHADYSKRQHQLYYLSDADM